MANLAAWQGYIAYIDDEDVVWVLAHDMAEEGTEITDEFGIARDKFPEAERNALQDGTYVEVFITEEEALVVRKLDVGIWTQEELDECKTRAEELHKLINWGL
jgi:hypothetical protein